MEHSLFLHLGLEDTSLKAQGMELYEQWKYFMNKTFVVTGIDNPDRPIPIVLNNDHYASLQNVDIDFGYVLELIDKLRKYKEGVIKRLENGEWLGWLWITFVRHILRELEFLDFKINKNHVIKRDLKYTDEIAFWNTTNGEHIGMGAHLLDPDTKNDDLFKAANDLYHLFPKIPSEERLTYLKMLHSPLKSKSNIFL